MLKKIFIAIILTFYLAIISVDSVSSFKTPAPIVFETASPPDYGCRKKALQRHFFPDYALK